MKKLLFWLANIFKVDLTVEKVVYKDKIVEVIKEVPKEVIVEKEVIKEVIKEVPIYKEVKYIALKDEVTDDTYVEGNLFVTGNIYVAGNITAFGGVVCGLSDMEVKMKAGKDVTAYKITED